MSTMLFINASQETKVGQVKDSQRMTFTSGLSQQFEATK